MFKWTSWILMVAVVVASAVSAEAGKGNKKKGAKSPEKRFAKLDVNKDGKISPEEFTAKTAADKKDHAAKRFKKVDTNGDGYLEIAELKAAVKPKK